MKKLLLYLSLISTLMASPTTTTSDCLNNTNGCYDCNDVFIASASDSRCIYDASLIALGTGDHIHDAMDYKSDLNPNQGCLSCGGVDTKAGELPQLSSSVITNLNLTGSRVFGVMVGFLIMTSLSTSTKIPAKLLMALKYLIRFPSVFLILK